MFIIWTVCSTGQYCLKIGRSAEQDFIVYRLDGVRHRAVVIIDWTVCFTGQYGL
jgi:hypothetical protein